MSQHVRANFDLQVDNMLPFHQLIVIKCSLYAPPPPRQSHLSVLLILLVCRPPLISLGSLLLITPQSNLLLFHLERQIGRIRKKGGKERKEWEGRLVSRQSSGRPPLPLCGTCARIPSGIIIKKSSSMFSLLIKLCKRGLLQ